MAEAVLASFIRRVRRSALLREDAELTDGQLLDRYLAGQDEFAFEAIVRRHGRMVLGVCRRILRNSADAEDAFQAVFLVLVRRAGSFRSRDGIGNWLYGVARNTAMRARAAVQKRRIKESAVPVRSTCEEGEEADYSDLKPLLDRELYSLRDKYREAVVLCDLEGKPRREAARSLGIPEGTLSSRLATAHRTLARRLAQRGVALSGAAFATILYESTASAAVPASLVKCTTDAAALFAAGQVTAAGIVSANVVTLTNGVLKTMFFTKCKIVVLALLTVGLLTMGTTRMLSLTVPSAQAQDSALADDKPSDKAADKPAADKPSTVKPADKAADKKPEAEAKKEEPKAKTFEEKADLAIKALLDQLGPQDIIHIAGPEGTIVYHKATGKVQVMPRAGGAAAGRIGEGVQIGGAAGQAGGVQVGGAGQAGAGIRIDGGAGGIQINPNVPGIPGRVGGAAKTGVTIERKPKDAFTAKYQEGELAITVSGKVVSDKAQVDEIEIKEGAKASKYKTVNEVPEKFQEDVKFMIWKSERDK